MSSQPEKKPEAGKSPAKPESGEIACQFLASELEAARKSLKRTQIVSCVLVVVVLSYMGFITVKIRDFMEPVSAAELITGTVAEKVTDHATEFATELRQELPKRIASAPDMLLTQLPVWREDLEEKLEIALEEQLNEHSTDFGKHLDTLLAQHEAEIGELLQQTGDQEKTKILLTSIEQDIMELLEGELEGGESIKAKLQFTLDALQNIEKQMERLANGKDLSDHEKRTRRAIALITSKVDAARAQEPVKKDESL